MHFKGSSAAPRRSLPAAWSVALWLSGTTAAFVALALWVRPASWAFITGEIDRRIVHLAATRGLEFFLVLLAVLVVEAVVLGWRRSALGRLVRPSRSARTDLFIAAAVNLGWWPFVLIFFSAGWIWAIERIASRFGALHLIGALGPGWVQFLVVLVVTDFFGYWLHRTLHDIDFLWEAHKIHHAATEFTILTGSRDHPLEDVFQHIVVSVPLAALGAPVETYIGVRLLMYVIQLLQHSMVPWTYGWVGRWLIYSPVGHRIHHSPRSDQHTSNYGNTFVFWDRLFGTWYPGEDVNESIGLPHNPYNRQGVVVELLHAVARMGRVLRNSLRTGRWRTGPGTTGG